jgi:hypothetical protein
VSEYNVTAKQRANILLKIDGERVVVTSLVLRLLYNMQAREAGIAMEVHAAMRIISFRILPEISSAVAMENHKIDVFSARNKVFA